jgi:pimeloyl-ACP methyl ester carboxylesterase
MSTADASGEYSTITLPHKPSATISYRLIPGQGHSPLSATHLVVFLNGLMTAQDGWEPALALLHRSLSDQEAPDHPPLLTYDRYGQGLSSQDPQDEYHGGMHDLRESMHDLDVLTQEIWPASHHHHQQKQHPPPPPRLVLVAHSIGCVLARLYAASHAGSVAALVLLDSNMANSSPLDVFPDPNAPDFSPDMLPPDVSELDLRGVRARYAAQFGPSAPNPEHLDRRNVGDLLPYADRPLLRGPRLEPEPRDEDGNGNGSGGPFVVVVGHDWDVFAQQSWGGSLKTPVSLTNMYMNPAWDKYNQGLVSLTDQARGEGPITARGCGHFIQKDDPALVASIVIQLLDRLRAVVRY